jgi:hypothetical protein
MGEASAKVKGVVDLVMLIDCSGSMQDCIDAIKQSIAAFVQQMSAADANGGSPVRDWRMKICGYRDHPHDGESWFVDNPFVADLAGVQAQLNAPALRATGGGDEPESLLDALFKVASMEQTGPQDAPSPERWRQRGTATRVVVFFTDASFKDPMTIPEAAGGSIGDVVNKIMSQRIVMCGFMPEWEKYEFLGGADKAEFNYVVRIADNPALAGLGKPGSEGDAASRAAVAALKNISADADGFKKIMLQLAKTVAKSAAVEAC